MKALFYILVAICVLSLTSAVVAAHFAVFSGESSPWADLALTDFFVGLCTGCAAGFIEIGADR